MTQVRNGGNIARAADQKQAVVQTKKQPQTVQDFIRAYKGQFEKALNGKMSGEQFVRVALTALQTTPKLQQCDTGSLIAALLTSAQLGLTPNTPLGQAYLVPYGNTVQFIVG